jgi:hypothetical protein
VKRSADGKAIPKERFCAHCRSAVLSELRRSGFLTKTFGDKARFRGAEAKENLRETRLGRTTTDLLTYCPCRETSKIEEVMEGNYSFENLEERMEAAKKHHWQLLHDYEEAYDVRCEHRKKCGILPIGFCGMGRAGKDTGAEYMCEHVLGMKYPGSNSQLVLPFMAHVIGLPKEQVFKERHEHREFWIAALHAFRGKDYTKIIRMCLGAGDVSVGIRGRLELDAAIRSNTVQLAMWIENPRVPKDITVEYGPEDCDVMVPNCGSLLEFYSKIQRLIRVLYPRCRGECDGKVFERSGGDGRHQAE